jgi:hypothetical protein
MRGVELSELSPNYAMEKTVQIIYETRQRPKEHQHPPWIARIEQQLGNAVAEKAFAGLVRFSERAEALPEFLACPFD